jgi:hypothetical protein
VKDEPIMKGLRAVVGLLIASSFLRADGGTMRPSERAGGYQDTVFTFPAPLRAGPVDVSVFVQDANTSEPAEGVDVAVCAALSGRPEKVVGSPATSGAATNKPFRSTLLELPERGPWEFEATVDAGRGQARVRFTAEAADRPPGWLAVAPWIGWPALAILLFAIHQMLMRRIKRLPERDSNQ